MKYFLRICPQIFISAFFAAIILLSAVMVQAIPIQVQGASLPKPNEIVLTSKKDIPKNVWIAKRYLEKGKFREVISICEQVLSLKADQVDARAYLAVAYKALGNNKRYELEVEIIKKQAPGSPYLYLALAQASLARKELKDAESYYQKGLETVSEKNDLHMGLAGLYVQQGQLDKASAQYREVLKAKNIAIKYFLNASFALCRIDLQQNNYDSVIKRAKVVVDLYPPIPQGHILLAKAYFAKGEKDKALEVYKNFIKVVPDSSQPYQELSLIYSEKLNDHKNALKYALTGINKFPKDAKSRDILGWVYYNKGEYKNSIKGFQDAVQLAPKIPQYFYHLGLAQQKIGDKGRAKESFSEALGLLHPDADKKFRSELNDRVNQCK